MKSLLLLPILFISLNFINVGDKSACRLTDHGPAIDWKPDVKLKWSDFQAVNKPGRGFAIATSSCGFGYNGEIRGNEIVVNVYVRFYCNESWHHKNYLLDEVLDHEQLHFDICELYGRIFYKNIVDLRRKGLLNERSLKNLLTRLQDEYDGMQDRYDLETRHSTNGSAQHQWNQYIKRSLDEYKRYAGYREY